MTLRTFITGNWVKIEEDMIASFRSGSEGILKWENVTATETNPEPAVRFFS